jgi:hypothetical protein
MTQQTGWSQPCRVTGAEKLPSEVGGAGAICDILEEAIRKRMPDTAYAVEVRAISTSSLAAVVTLGDGRVLPEQKMAVSDRQLNQQSIEWFAAGLAEEIAKAVQR